MTCKSCGLEHRGWVSCLKAKTDAQKVVVHEEPVVVHKIPITPQMDTVLRASILKTGEVKAEGRHGKYADLEARKAYRKEWMRKRRG